MHAGSSGYSQSWVSSCGLEIRRRLRPSESGSRKTDREDARLMLKLLRENRFPKIWVPSPENRDLRQLLWHRHRLVQMRTRIMNQLQAVAMNEGYRWKKKLFSEKGRALLEKLSLAPWASRRLLSPTPTLRALPRATLLFASPKNKFFLAGPSATVFTLVPQLNLHEARVSRNHGRPPPRLYRTRTELLAPPFTPRRERASGKSLALIRTWSGKHLSCLRDPCLPGP